jgi:prephenate dehydrogenase
MRDDTQDLVDFTVTVVGLGLMGGSLAGALRGKCQRVIGVDRDTPTSDRALELGFVDEVAQNLSAGLERADVVVLATPVRAIIDILGQIGPMLRPDTLVMDIGSTKTQVLAAMADLPANIQVLGGHPMCGKELSGIDAADPRLFEGRTFILSPLARTSDAALATGYALVRAVGAYPLEIEGDRQDYLVGTISHLPYLLACALVSTADATTSSDPLVWQILAGGYRDTSRVAGSDVTMMLDILMTNRDEVVKAARIYQAYFAELTSLVEAGDETALRARLSDIRDTRKEMYP